MKNQIKPILLSTTLALTLSGCMSLSTYQTADVVAKGDIEYGVGVSQFSISSSGSEEDSGDWESIPTPEGYIRFGVGEKTDMGIKIYPFSTIFDIKHQMQKTEKQSNAVGVGLSWLQIDDQNIVDVYASYYHTFYHSERVSSTIAPKVIFRSNDDNDRQETVPGITYTLDYKFEDSTISIRPEIGIYKADEFMLGHFGFGINF